MELRELTYISIVVRITVALALGGILGLERELKHRPAGLRTYMLVCVGACMIMLVNQYIYQIYGTGDPVRMGAQVVSGIGFLGAGTIVVTRYSQIKGLTTAAGLWTSAAVGLTVGIGFYEAALVGVFAIFITLTLLGGLDNRIHSKTRYFNVYVELPKMTSLRNFLNAIREKGLVVVDMQLDTDGRLENGTCCYMMTLKAPSRLNQADLLAQIKTAAGVVHLEVL